LLKVCGVNVTTIRSLATSPGKVTVVDSVFFLSFVAGAMVPLVAPMTAE
jgi:hypothetical protein